MKPEAPRDRASPVDYCVAVGLSRLEFADRRMFK